MIYLDTETCGLHGIVVLIQYIDAPRGTGEPVLHHPWYNTVADNKKLIEYFCTQDVCAFNLTFDWFHIQKFYGILCELKGWEDFILKDIPMQDIVEAEYRARLSTPCVKPKGALCLYLYAMQGPYQSTMERKDIRLKKVPAVLAEDLVTELDKRIDIKQIYFARGKKHFDSNWRIEPTKEKDFVDIVLRFKASRKLKHIAKDMFGGDYDLFTEVAVPKEYNPKELGYAPYAKALPNHQTWDKMVDYHIQHWRVNERAKKYAANDVILLKQMDKVFEYPEVNDVNSELAICVACNRWRGYNIDMKKLKEIRNELKALVVPGLIDSRQAKRYLKQVMSPDLRAAFTSTKKQILEGFVKDYRGEELAERAQKVLDARQAMSKVKLVDKLYRAKRLHASFKVIGALSSRMSGGDGLNPQGIQKGRMRQAFTLADSDMKLSGGDFSAFEVVLAAHVYKDEDLKRDLRSGKKIHAIFGTYCYPEYTYEDLVSEATDDLIEKYTRAKSAVFAKFYGGNAFTLHTRLAITMEDAERAEMMFERKYPQIRITRLRIEAKFSALSQPGGIGSKIVYKQPADYVEEPVTGHRRYFTLENKLIESLFQLAQNPPPEWKKKYSNVKVKRRDRIQVATGALQSALYAAAFAVQSSNIRAAGNHEIQSAGAVLTKELQRRIWRLQPVGVHKFVVCPMNVHDEVLAPSLPDYVDRIKKTVEDFIAEKSKLIDMLKMDWKTGIGSWAEKKG